MTHLDPDRLVLIALGEQTADQTEEQHLVTCDACRGDLSTTHTVAGIARHSEDLNDLPAASAGLWQRVAAEAFAEPAPAKRPQSNRRPAPTRPANRPANRPAGPKEGRWARSRLLLVAAAALVLGIASTVGVTRLVSDRAKVVAEADLAPQAAAPAGAHGTVTVIDTGQGLQLRVSMTGMPTAAGYYTVWLFDGGSVMIPIGSPGGAALNVPATAADLTRYHIVDISLQRLGQQEHGTSMLQGTLVPRRPGE
jgi:hypothetical protein